MSEMMISSPSLTPDVSSTSSAPAIPMRIGTRTARSPRTTKAWTRVVVGEGPALHAQRALRSVMIRTSPRRLGRRPGCDGWASAAVNCSTPFSTVGKTSLTVPGRSASLSREDHRHAGRSRPACTSDTVAVTRNDVRSAMRAMTSPLRTSAFLRQHPRQHAVAIRLRRRHEAPRLRRFLVERSALEREAFQLHARSLLRVATLLLQLRQLDLRLLDRQLDRRSDSRNRALLEQLVIRIEPGLRRLELEAFTSRRPSRSTSDFSSVRRVCACWFSLILRSLTTLSSASTDSLMSSSTTGSPCFRHARPLQDLEHARVERAREHSLHIGHDRAGGRDDGFDGTRGDRRRADARTRERVGRIHPQRARTTATSTVGTTISARAAGAAAFRHQGEEDDPRRDHDQGPCRPWPAGSMTYG